MFKYNTLEKYIYFNETYLYEKNIYNDDAYGRDCRYGARAKKNIFWKF